ncbi:MAG: AraC family transcriptional regulator [Pyrinomonadaceae bacterium]|nr:AraC family transcriptional regulator [Pyrinomonadaceae bacterium]
MDSALSIEDFSLIEKTKTKANYFDVFDFPRLDGKIYISNQIDLGASEVLHYHDEPHLTMLVNGGVLDKRKSLEKDRLSGELMFFHSGEPHQTINKVFPTKYISLTFEPDFFQRNSITEAKLRIALEKNLNSNFTILKIYKELAINDEFTNCSSEMLLFNLIDEKYEVKTKRPNWINKVHQLLNDNWNKELALNDLAFAANVHPKTISRYFPKYFACSLGEYRRQLKVAKSLSLIKSSKFSLTEIAHECNFADQSHFIRDFKRMTGFLPKQFKKL